MTQERQSNFSIWVAPFLSGLFLGACSAPDSPAGISSACAAASDPAIVNIAGGSFVMGAFPRYAEEGPPRTVELAPFRMDVHEVTNAQFAAFVAETGYVTIAEQDPPPLESAPADMLLPGSAVFRTPSREDQRWWRWVVGANWRQPTGPGSSIAGHETDPVVQIAFADAMAYAEWAGGALPTEEQWEFAARSQSPAIEAPVDSQGRPAANTYQGVFPQRDLGTDGFAGRSPVGCFSANKQGLFDMIGNVWEWTAPPADAPGETAVIKGGSFLCAANYCARYRPAARQFQERGLGTDHIGFRLMYPAEWRVESSD